MNSGVLQFHGQHIKGWRIKSGRNPAPFTSRLRFDSHIGIHLLKESSSPLKAQIARRIHLQSQAGIPSQKQPQYYLHYQAYKHSFPTFSPSSNLQQILEGAHQTFMESVENLKRNVLNSERVVLKYGIK